MVSDRWWRDGAAARGAGRSLQDAKSIADQRSDYDDPVSSWRPWKDDTPGPGARATWTRDALKADGSVHPSLYQEIVQVPLTGQAEEG